MLVRMSLSDGGDAGLEEAEAGGMRARLAGRDVDMIESPSPSPSRRTDDGRGEASLESGLGGIGVGDCPRGWAFGILPAGCPASQRPMGPTTGTTNGNLVQTEMMGSSFSSFLPIQHDGGVATAGGRLLGCSDSQDRSRRGASSVTRCYASNLYPFVQKHAPVTSQPITTGGSRASADKAQGIIQEVCGQDPVAAPSGIVCQAVDVTQLLCGLPMVQRKSADETQRRDLEAQRNACSAAL